MAICPKCDHIIQDLKYGAYNTLILKLPDAPLAWECSKCGWDTEKDSPESGKFVPEELLLKMYRNLMLKEQSLHKIPLEEAIEVEYTNRFGTIEKRKVCPICVDHPQGSTSDVHDCKVEFTKPVTVDGRIMYETVGQCCCWSNAHLRRK